MLPFDSQRSSTVSLTLHRCNERISYYVSPLNVEILPCLPFHSKYAAQCWHLVDTQYMLGKL